ncbi:MULTISPECIES: trans-aconitate 2-methyltransferase [Nocardia]|uniref:Trans-aconitate 2-methyltransferase n=1 Tax=Nocardia implantans TaxID=3108168 RepID=A0ABU6ASH7_9NOCA|nr:MULTISPECIES: trans-aconitate 2-methyltransferase [unclassified Nocardia]MBF6191752.1 trans-aconitate 2-methyltransferase [Nocardia beijingensis]MEA3527937.1 trans-aconitate 2-methyltransferase [Nocardia sp. CDC192]MEB3510311.1 trans-aconitate 2-methyltransferase [Nocardia sp. CDC186]
MWDPQQYLAFDDHRSRPFFDLLSRVTAAEPGVVVDLGCGPGHLTEVLARRWPGARVQALDSSPEMVAAARDRGLDATLGSVQDWRPSAQTDVVICNAVLHWVPEHADLLSRWMRQLRAGAFLALQVPGNFDAASHRAIRQVAARDEWRDSLARAGILEPRAVLDPAGYADLLAAAGGAVDAWETTYLHRLTGDDPVLEWVTGTALRPVRGALDDAQWREFTAQLAPLLRGAYPRRADGTTWLPFRRVFAVARKR